MAEATKVANDDSEIAEGNATLVEEANGYSSKPDLDIASEKRK